MTTMLNRFPIYFNALLTYKSLFQKRYNMQIKTADIKTFTMSVDDQQLPNK